MGVPISSLPAASALTGAELIPVVQSGQTKRTTTDAIPYVPAGTGAVTTTVQNKLREFVSVKDFGANGDGTDATSAFIAAAAASNLIEVPDGVYELTTVTISTSVKFFGSGTVKWKANYDQNDVAWSGANIAMFDVVQPNLRVEFSGITFDGNEANQSVATPSGSLIRSWNQFSAATDLSEVVVDGCTFKDQTFSSITVNGGVEADSRTIVTVTNCTFLDGRLGIGSGDANSTNTNGFAPFYINCFDHTQLIASGNKFLYRKAIASTREYAPSGIRYTWSESSTNAGGASGMVANNYFYRLGRKDQRWDGAVSGNNGLGVVDFYSRGREIIIQGNTFDACFNSAVRGKTNVDKAVIVGNIIENTPLAINIGPPTYTDQLGYIAISGNVIRNTDTYAIGVVGLDSMLPGYVTSVTITGNVIENVTNVNGTTGNIGGIVCRYHDNVVVANNSIRNVANGNGILARDSVKCSVIANSISDVVSGRGIYFNISGEKAVASSNVIKSVGGGGIYFDTTTTTDVVASGNVIDTVVDYGIIAQQGASVCITSNNIKAVSGLSRGIYTPALAVGVVSGNHIDSAVTTKLFYTVDGGVQNIGNSFNPIEAYRSSAPTTGTWKVGDKIWSTVPATTGFIGWICTVAGTPGTWKTFGAISA